jgi:hypothetical protein
MIALRARNFRATGILLAAAFLLQSLFVQAHVHAAATAAPVAGAALADASGPAGQTSKHEPAGSSPYCFLCWEAAMAGQFIQPTVEFVLPLQPPVIWAEVRALAGFALGKFSHGWLSRAPPQ